MLSALPSATRWRLPNGTTGEPRQAPLSPEPGDVERAPLSDPLARLPNGTTGEPP